MDTPCYCYSEPLLTYCFQSIQILNGVDNLILSAVGQSYTTIDRKKCCLIMKLFYRYL